MEGKAMMDGNTFAINKHLAEREAYDLAHPADLYCPACDETIRPLDFPEYVNEDGATCPNCGDCLLEAK